MAGAGATDRLVRAKLSDGEYRRLTATPAGILESRVFPGLRLAVDALLQGDIAKVLAKLQNGLSTPEHAGFVEALRLAVHPTLPQKG